TWPSMTTVEVPLKQMAEEACELLLRRIKEKDEDETQERTPKKIALAAKLMIRESVRRIDE
ncbi:MAG: substrate-binding domain-containing protein, partial [Clostridia bacterium]